MKFTRENRLFEVYQEVNRIIGERDKTHKTGRNQIDTVFSSEPIINCTEGSRLLDFDEVIITDHRGFMVDIDFNVLFNINHSKYDQSNIRSLNPTNRVH